MSFESLVRAHSAAIAHIDDTDRKRRFREFRFSSGFGFPATTNNVKLWRQTLPHSSHPLTIARLFWIRQQPKRERLLPPPLPDLLRLGWAKSFGSEARSWQEFFEIIESWAVWRLHRWFYQCSRRRAFQRWWKHERFLLIDTHLIPDLTRIVVDYIHPNS